MFFINPWQERGRLGRPARADMKETKENGAAAPFSNGFHGDDSNGGSARARGSHSSDSDGSHGSSEDGDSAAKDWQKVRTCLSALAASILVV